MGSLPDNYHEKKCFFSGFIPFCVFQRSATNTTRVQCYLRSSSSFGWSTADHLPTSHSCILFCPVITVMNLLSVWLLSDSSIFYILYLTCLLSTPPNHLKLSCPSDVLISNPIHPCHAHRKSYHLQHCQLGLLSCLSAPYLLTNIYLQVLINVQIHSNKCAVNISQ